MTKKCYYSYTSKFLYFYFYSSAYCAPVDIPSAIETMLNITDGDFTVSVADGPWADITVADLGKWFFNSEYFTET